MTQAWTNVATGYEGGQKQRCAMLNAAALERVIAV
jgi:hypothetical protein